MVLLPLLNILMRISPLLFPVLLLSCTLQEAGVPDLVEVRESAAGDEGPGVLTEIVARTLVSDLREPWGMDFLPDGRLLLTEKPGTLKLVDPDSWESTAVAGVPATEEQGQGGMMDVLVHPDFEQDPWIYLSYTVGEGGSYSTRVGRARLQGQALVDFEVLFTAQPYFPQRRHFGSRLLLVDGYLYIGIGDRGNRDLAQSLETHNGKILRLHDNGEIPAQNPFLGVPGARPEIFTYGHRNPQGIARNPYNGAIWISEHGPRGGDEINVLRSGANYGWPLITYGREYSGGEIGEGTQKEGMEQPLLYYPESPGVGGIDFYTGTIYAHWKDSLLVSSLRLARINRHPVQGDQLGEERHLLGNVRMRIRDLQVGPDGLIYALADGSRLIRLEPPP